jgi:hypothetical protein
LGHDLKEAAGMQVRITKQIRLAHHWAGSDARLLQLFHNLPRRVLLCPGCDLRIQYILMPIPTGRVGKACVASPRRISQNLTKAVPFHVVGDGNDNPAIAPPARIAAVRGHEGVSIAQARLDTAVHGVIHQAFADGLHQVLGLGEVDDLALAGAPSVVQGGHYGKCCSSTADGIHMKGRAGIGQVALRIRS